MLIPNAKRNTVNLGVTPILARFGGEISIF